MKKFLILSTMIAAGFVFAAVTFTSNSANAQLSTKPNNHKVWEDCAFSGAEHIVCHLGGTQCTPSYCPE